MPLILLPVAIILTDDIFNFNTEMYVPQVQKETTIRKFKAS